MKNNINILKEGLFIDIFERDGFETSSGEIIQIVDNCLYIREKNHLGVTLYKVPYSSIKRLDIGITTKGNSLEKYEVQDGNILNIEQDLPGVP